MAAKTANVVARVEPDIKSQAESIMERLGISASTAINLFYRQVIYKNGMPFSLTVPAEPPKAYDELTKDELDAAMSLGYEQAKTGKGAGVDEVFNRLIMEINNG